MFEVSDHQGYVVCANWNWPISFSWGLKNLKLKLCLKSTI